MVYEFCSFQRASLLFNRLVDVLRQLDKLNEELKGVSVQTVQETAELLKKLEETRVRLVTILKQFPANTLPPCDTATGDAVANARTVDAGVWGVVQRLEEVSL